MLILAAVAGLLAMVLAARWLRAQSDAQVGALVVTRQAIGSGVSITADMLTRVEWPIGKEPPGAHVQLDKLVGRVTNAALIKGEPVLEGRLAPPGAKAGLASMLAEGKRAITVRTNDVVGVAGFITPGSFVDVLVSTSSGPDGQPVSKIVLEKMLVLAVAQDVERDPSQAKVANAVTLEVTPEQAEALDLARTIGNLSLALRNPREDGLVDTAGATRGSVLGTSQPPTSPVAAASADPAAPRRTTSGARTLLAGITPAAAASAAASPVGPEPTCVKVVRGDSHTMECF